VEAFARGWDRLSNGALLKAAEEAGFDLLLSTDKNIQYQQNLKGRRIAVVCVTTYRLRNKKCSSEGPRGGRSRVAGGSVFFEHPS